MSKRKEIEHIENYSILCIFSLSKIIEGKLGYITTDFFLISLLKDKWYLYAIVRQR